MLSFRIIKQSLCATLIMLVLLVAWTITFRTLSALAYPVEPSTALAEGVYDYTRTIYDLNTGGNPPQAPSAVTALHFDGTNDYVTFGQASGLGAATFTIETWFMREGTGVATSTGTGGVNAIPLVTKGRAEAENSNVDMNYFLGIDSVSNRLAADFEEGTAGASPGLNHPITGTTTIANNVWYHAAVTYDGTTWRLYLNGNLERQLAVGQPPRSDSIQHAGLGTAMTSTGAEAGFLQGTLDETRIWNSVRTAAQIQAAMSTEIITATGLLGRWGMNEGLGMQVADSSGNGNNGTATNGPTWVPGYPFVTPTPTRTPTAGSLTPTSTQTRTPTLTRTPTRGSFTPTSTRTSTPPPSQALDFDGTNDYVTFGAAPGLGVVTFTLETWFRRDGPGAGTSTGSGGIADAIPLIAKGRAEGDGSNVDMNYFLGIQASTNKLIADFEEGAGGDIPGANHPMTGTTVISNGVWHHAAVTFDLTNMRLYLDGRLEAVAPIDEPPRSDSIQHAALASALDSDGVAAGFFEGRLDEAHIWNYARSGQQIRQAKNLQFATSPGLIGRWSMNEGTSTFVGDSSGGGNNGTATNGPTWATGHSFPQDTTAPAAPQNLVAIPGPGRVSLTWNANNETDLAGYNLFRSTASPVPTTGIPVNGEDLLTGQAYSDIGLAGNTTYYYVLLAVDTAGNVSNRSNQVSATTQAIPTATRTATPDPNAVVLVGAGDIASCTSTGDEATADLLDNIPGSIFTTGDNVYQNGTIQEFTSCYEPSWGRHKSRTRPAPGNHDYGNALYDPSGYFAYFGAAAGDPDEGYYSYDLGNFWHIIVLNSELGGTTSRCDGCVAGSPQELWLRSDLAANLSKNVIALWHEPRWSSNGNDTRTSVLWQDLHNYGADLVLVGHHHIYERFAPQNGTGQLDNTYGVRQFTVGTGGAGHHSLGSAAPNSEVRNNDTFGVFKLTLRPTSYDWQFIPVAGATFTDSGSGLTHGPPPGGIPTNTPTAVPSVTNTPTNTPTNLPTNTRTSTITPTPTFSNTATNTRTSTITPTYTDTATNTPTNTITPTPTYTNTPTDTPTSTYTPTFGPTVEALIVGHVVWEGRPAQPHASQQLPITLTLKQGSIEENYPAQVTDASGHFTVSVSLPGTTYQWRVKGPRAISPITDTNSTPGFLAATGFVTLSGSPIVDVEIGLLKAGDCNNDNLVTAVDFNILRPAFGRAMGDPGYDNRADFTGNGQVSVVDFNIIKTNFGSGGSPPSAPARR